MWVVDCCSSVVSVNSPEPTANVTYLCLNNAQYTLEGEIALSVQKSRICQSDLFLRVVWVLLSCFFPPSLSSALGCCSPTAEQELFSSLSEVTMYFANSYKRRCCCSDSGENYTFVLWKWLVGRSSGQANREKQHLLRVNGHQGFSFAQQGALEVKSTYCALLLILEQPWNVPTGFLLD